MSLYIHLGETLEYGPYSTGKTKVFYLVLPRLIPQLKITLTYDDNVVDVDIGYNVPLVGWYAPGGNRNFALMSPNIIEVSDATEGTHHCQLHWSSGTGKCSVKVEEVSLSETDIGEVIEDVTEEITNDMVESIDEVEDDVQDILDSIENSISDIEDSITESIAAMETSITSSLSTGLSAITNVLSPVISSISDTILETAGKTDTLLSDVFDRVTFALGVTAETISDGLDYAGMAVETAIESLTGRIEEALEIPWSKLGEFVKGLIDYAAGALIDKAVGIFIEEDKD